MRELTPYENVDVNSGARDEEVYLYNAEKNETICASCNPDGTRPEGLRDTQKATEEAGEGVTPLVDSQEIWINLSENAARTDLSGGQPARVEPDLDVDRAPTAALPERQRPPVLRRARQTRAAGHGQKGERLRVRAGRHR